MTSQILSNIYLNEFDRFIKHQMKPLAYLRYGDDWLCFAESTETIKLIRKKATGFLGKQLALTINPKINRISRAYTGVSYLGVDIWPTGRRLQLSVSKRVGEKLAVQNVASYRALVASHEKRKRLKELDWRLLS